MATDLPADAYRDLLATARRTLRGRGLPDVQPTDVLHEACVQLRGDGGERQVPGRPEVAVVSNGGGPIAGCMLLTR